MAEAFNKGGQDGWYHDPGFWGGFFHTYDRFQVGKPSDPSRTLHVFLPRDYEISPTSYPVLYLNDGHTVFFPGGAYNKTWNLARILSRLYLRQQIGKLIVVALCPVDRDFEYTHAPVWGHDWGGLEDYALYVSQAVKGFIDAQYRTLADAEHTVIGGASHGGLAAFYTAVKHPDRFAGVIAMSPSFWVGLDSGVEFSMPNYTGPFFGDLKTSALLFEAEQTLRQHRLKKIYLDWGLMREGGEHNSQIEERATVRGREMHDLLVREFGYRDNVNLFVVEDPIGQHVEESWAGRMEEYVLKIFFGI
jgi:pimeloyl-ACP methyl ester carboxylesterase